MGNAAIQFDIKMDDLCKLMQARDVEVLQKKVGGTKGLETKLKTNLVTGLTDNRRDLTARRKAFGRNDIDYKRYSKNILSKQKLLMVIRNGEINKIGYKNVVVGDLLQVKAGDTITVDGILVDGSVKTDESSLSGDTYLLQHGAEKFPYLLAGSYIRDGSAKLLVLAVGEHTQCNSLKGFCEHHYIFIG